MDYYFTAADDAAALAARNLTGGPMPGKPGIDSVGAKDVVPCPHLEQLVSMATGKSGSSLVPELEVLWPEPPGCDSGPSITRLPDSLRDNLADVAMTAELASGWAKEMWGFDPAHALAVGTGLVQLAQTALKQNRSLYWWSEM